ncbi:ADP-ribose pyrophosphatase YjhB, NUDIX family [Allokutzneria albata]|uniref:ADP-ribose pyrophosphatase YjhB, NUDIX family n=1 Tax=Allokutzneria albata TaxID=211114 RepID=A0A1H0A4M6_ALLAB|nr:ADP-ribose pyrophosphatase YjhB, NUDIX family [Allokutzneria albata]
MVGVRLIDRVAWLNVRAGKVLGARSTGNDVFYLPGGKREPGESDVDTLRREVREELGITVLAEGAECFGVFEAQAHGFPPGVLVRTACYTAAFTGEPSPCGEIAELSWIGPAQRDQLSAADGQILDRMLAEGLVWSRP